MRQGVGVGELQRLFADEHQRHSLRLRGCHHAGLMPPGVDRGQQLERLLRPNLLYGDGDSRHYVLRCYARSASNTRNQHRAGGHGLVQRHCTTGIAGRHPENRPLSSPSRLARATSSRVSSPACCAYSWIRSDSVANVTELTTNLPPRHNAACAISITSAVAPPPIKTAFGAGRSRKASGAAPSITSSWGTPRLLALRRMRAARSRRRSIAIAVHEASHSIHSIPMDPEPAPISHKSSPRCGCSEDRVNA